MNPGKIIILNGPANIDKMNILAALQMVLDEPYLHVGFGQLIDLLPSWEQAQLLPHERMEAALGDADPCSRHLISGWHQTIAALARSGNHVIADHMLVNQRWLRECALLFCDLPAFLVGVHSPADRCEGPTQAHTHRAVHQPGVYDLNVDPSLLSPTNALCKLNSGYRPARPQPGAGSKRGPPRPSTVAGLEAV